MIFLQSNSSQSFKQKLLCKFQRNIDLDDIIPNTWYSYWFIGQYIEQWDIFKWIIDVFSRSTEFNCTSYCESWIEPKIDYLNC